MKTKQFALVLKGTVNTQSTGAVILDIVGISHDFSKLHNIRVEKEFDPKFKRAVKDCGQLSEVFWENIRVYNLYYTVIDVKEIG